MDERELRYPERVAVARLHALLELLPTALDKRMQPAGLTSFEFTLLEALAETGDGKLRLSALASRTNATLARLSRVVTGLERKGLVRRAPCAEDARATNAVLTEQGREVYRESTPLYADAVSSMILDGLTEGDVDDLARLAFAILTRLDPDRRLAVTSVAGVSASGVPVSGVSTAGLLTAEASTAEAPSDDCPADPAPAASDDDCPADPAPAPSATPAGSVPAVPDDCPADPADLSDTTGLATPTVPADLAGLVASAAPTASTASTDLAALVAPADPTGPPTPTALVDPEQLAAEACPADPAPSRP
ncbi:MarR family winged helix-turn-helix transcriptional regulator [Promicromonospora sp. NPDC060204]|uniref:MarR family winged helix-turn-helix transcriptional regulator n=1 Tax=Promicromonospora sp. NPDC060204 TaxID=3347071 RepID=UPI003661D6EE